jgi:hypothetical protein
MQRGTTGGFAATRVHNDELEPCCHRVRQRTTRVRMGHASRHGHKRVAAHQHQHLCLTEGRRRCHPISEQRCRNHLPRLIDRVGVETHAGTDRFEERRRHRTVGRARIRRHRARVRRHGPRPSRFESRTQLLRDLIHRLLDGDIDIASVRLPFLGMQQAVFTTPHCRHVLALDTAEPFVQRIVDVAFHRNGASLVDFDQDSAARMTDSADRVFPGTCHHKSSFVRMTGLLKALDVSP